ncbi:MAG: hypothetical protein H7A16_07190 [Sinobacteraceae bacterium]|nr:hypothetical protein [Nevskiaceae bacterium]
MNLLLGGSHKAWRGIDIGMLAQAMVALTRSGRRGVYRHTRRLQKLATRSRSARPDGASLHLIVTAGRCAIRTRIAARMRPSGRWCPHVPAAARTPPASSGEQQQRAEPDAEGAAGGDPTTPMAMSARAGSGRDRPAMTRSPKGIQPIDRPRREWNGARPGDQQRDADDAEQRRAKLRGLCRRRRRLP